jgi:alkanesulfonate monooxygenase SsuD/methylene tetrahydromethanopterin reductase-like flavin-dependent oxidoreductase (luciferase family)
VKIALVFGMKMFKVHPLREMIYIARVADELGFDYLCLAEHVLMHGQPSAAAHTTGPVMHTPDELMPEPLTTLAAFAGATRRIGLMTGILIAPSRPAPLLAKTAATLHALAGGKRLVLGVSTSWQAEELGCAQRSIRGTRPAIERDARGMSCAVVVRTSRVPLRKCEF